MVRQRLARLERAALKIRAGECSHCGGRNGVGAMPLLMMFGKLDGTGPTTYDANRRCTRCGAEPGIVVNVTTMDEGEGEIPLKDGP